MKLEIAVNFNSSGVNIHGLQLLLFDKHGRLARIYRTLIWDNAEVLNDLPNTRPRKMTATANPGVHGVHRAQPWHLDTVKRRC